MGVRYGGPMEQFDWFAAAFEPRRTDDLKPAAAEWIGWTGLWEAAFLIEEGEYEGEFACTVKFKSDGTYAGESYPPTSAFVWVPQFDLRPIPIPGRARRAIIERATQILRGQQTG
jgi:hypothetical protein